MKLFLTLSICALVGEILIYCLSKMASEADDATDNEREPHLFVDESDKAGA